MRATMSWAAALCLAGCATAATARPGPASGTTASAGAEAAPSTELSRLSKAFEEQTRRVAELEARLSLLETEARETRDRSNSSAAAPPAKPIDSVHISTRHREESRADAESSQP